MAKSPINTAGSRAGRGFRYQDAVAALLAVRGWADVSPFGKITPEGNDDCDLESATARVFAQIKSRRDDIGPFSLGGVATFVTELWDRHDAAAIKPDELWLILERPFKDAPPLTTLGPLPAVLLATPKLRDDPRFAALAARTRIMVAPAPMNVAVTVIAETLECAPAEGSIHYANVLHQVGRLADANGTVKFGAFASITKTDVTALIDDMRGLVALDDMDAALRDGICEAIDFLTPIDDPDFYLGVDVEPGHLAAGLVAERPEARADLVAALERRAQALAVGPSGAGKSALMWDAAATTRHVIRWYRVRAATEAQVPALVRLARALRGSASAPVGFVFDDVGGDLRPAWDALSRLTPAGSGVVMLGSIREEDLFQIETRARIGEVRAEPNDALAERLWIELRDRDATIWAGWREPWAMSGGLMLEYAHILTQGDRMIDVLAAQVDRREREGRDLELAILRVTSFTGAASALVDTVKLARQLHVSDGDFGRAMRRLVDEHLVREPRDGLVGGMHQLRSKHLLTLTHRTPPPTLETTIANAVPTIPAASLEAIAANAELEVEGLEALLVALAARLDADPDPIAAAAAFRGLGERQIHMTLAGWIPTALARGIAPAHVSTAVMFGIPGASPIDLPQLEKLNAATADLVAARGDDLRTSLLARLSLTTLTALADVVLERVEELLASLIGADAAPLVNALRQRTFDISPFDLDATVGILGTLALFDRALAKSVVDAAGQQTLLDRLHAETPWSSPFTVEDEADGRVVSGEIRLAAPSVQTDAHAEVIAVVDSLFALVPDADIAAVSAIAPDGEPAGFGDYPLVVKRMPRSAAPAASLPRWNRRWMTATSAQLGAKSYTDFLERGYRGLSTVVGALDAFCEGHLRGKVSQASLDALSDAYDISRDLTSPAGAAAITAGGPAKESGAYVSDLQSVIHDAATDLPRKYNAIPDQHGAFLVWTNALLDRLEKARREPWVLIDKDPKPLFDRLRDIILGLQVIAGEAARRGGRPDGLWAKDAKTARKGNALRLVAHQATATRARQLDALKVAIDGQVATLGLRGVVDVRLERDASVDWPFASVLIVIDVESQADFVPIVLEHWETLKAAAGEGRRLILVPRVHGLVIGRRTIEGWSTAFPMPGAADDRLREAGHTLLDEAQTSRLRALFDALFEIDAIRQFDYATTERPQSEHDALATAIVARDESHAALIDGLGTELPEFPVSLGEFLRMIEDGEITFAADVAAVGHGGRPPVAESMELLEATTLCLDLIAHLQRRDGDDDTTED